MSADVKKEEQLLPSELPQPRCLKRFQLILIKPSHYDDDGYLIRWWRTMSPSNSLASVYGMAADCADRQVLGSDIAIDIVVWTRQARG